MSTIGYLSIILFVILLGVVRFLDYLRVKDKVDTLVRDVYDLSQEAAAKAKISDRLALQVEQMRREMSDLFKGSWTTLNNLCHQYFEKGDSDDKIRRTIIHDIEAEINKLKGQKFLAEVEAAANLYLDNIITRIRQQCPFLKDDDIALLTLSIAGFSPRTICLLRGLKLKNFYTRRSRILARIEASGLPDAHQIRALAS